MGTGLQEIPFRIPEKWDSGWYARHLRDVLALADARNSIGVGLTVTGEPNTLATYAVDEDIQKLVEQAFVLVSPSEYLPNERVLAVGDGLSLIDSGPGNAITIDLEDHGIPYDKLEGLLTFGVLGRSPEDPGGPEAILASENGDVLTVQSDVLGFTNTPIWTGTHNWLDGIAATWGTSGDLAISHDGANGAIANITGDLAIASAVDIDLNPIGTVNINGITLAEYIQDTIGAGTLADSASVDFVYNDGSNTITANVLPAGVDHNALLNYVADQHVAHSGVTFTAGAGLTGGGTIAANRTFDVGAGTGILANADDVAVDQAFSPTWTGRHTFTVQTVVLDYADSAYALSVRGATGRFLVRPYINATFGVGFEATNTAQTLNIPLTLIADPLKIRVGTEVARFDGSTTPGDTRFMVYDVDNATLERVTVGAPGSGGIGFKLLRIPN